MFFCCLWGCSFEGYSTAATVDYTTFTENDPTSQVTKTASCVSFNNIETRNTDAYVYKAYTVSGDFSFTLDTILTASNTYSGETLLWGLSNNAADTFEDWANGGLVLAVYNNGNPFLKLGTVGSYDTSVTLAKGVRYYVRVKRTGLNLKVDIYSNAAMTTLVDTLTKTLTSAQSFQYLYAFSTRTVSSTTKKATGDVCHLVDEAQGPSLPGAPVLNTPTAGNGTVNLSWNAVTGATGYKVKRGTSSGNYSWTMDVGNVTSYQVTGLTNGQTYYFVASAYNTSGEGANSNEQSATPQFNGQAVTFVSNVDYNAAGQIVKIVLGNGNVTDYTYHALSLRLTNIKTTTAQSQVVQDLSYTYDALGNILSITDNVNTATQSFGYDALNRLTSANAPATYYNKTYVYDSIGNIIQKDGIVYTYGQNGYGPHAVTSGSDGSSFSYDGNGNMISFFKGGIQWTYIYDSENRLVEVKKDSQTQAKFEYDGDGGRTKKITYTYPGGTPTTETARYVGSLYEVSETQATNHIFLGDTRIGSITNGLLKYYHADHLGGTNLVSDGQGAVKQIVEYDPYGSFARNTITGTADEQAWHLFTSKQFDDEAGLYYYGARYYNPVLGRFITADPTVQRPGDPQDLNRYAYARNNPVTLVDPTGYGWFSSFWKKASGFFGAIIGTAVGIASGNPFLGMGIYSAIGASSSGEHFGRDFGIGLVSGLVGWGIGAGISSLDWGFAGGFFASTAGGAGAGAVGAAMAGGNIGLAALSGAVGGGVGFATGQQFVGLGNILGGIAGAAVAGREIWEGAVAGISMNIGLYLGQQMIPTKTGEELFGNMQSGDVLYEKASIKEVKGGGLVGLATVLFGDPGPFGHTGIATDAYHIADSYPGSPSGPAIRSIKDHPAGNQARWAVIRTANTRLGATAYSLATSMQRAGYVFYGEGPRAVFCSQFAGKVYGEAGISGIGGVGPNTQYFQWRMRGR